MMKEEDLDKRIERVIESVGSKKAQMTEWDRARNTFVIRRDISFKHRRTYGISAAASVLLISAIGIDFYVNHTTEHIFEINPSPPVYDSGFTNIDEIKTMIDSEKYQDALRMIETMLSDTITCLTYSNLTYSNEKDLYYDNNNLEYELMWLKIQIFDRIGNKQEALSLLDSYVKSEGLHQIEAKELFDKLRK